MFYLVINWLIPFDEASKIVINPITDIPLKVVLVSFFLLLPLFWWTYFLPRKELNIYKSEELKFIFLNFILLFTIIIIFRTVILIRYDLPLEKIPMIYLIVIQIVFVEHYHPSDFGFHLNKFKNNITFSVFLLVSIGFLLIIIIGAIVFVLSIVGVLDLNELFQISFSFNWSSLLYSLPYQLFFVGLSEELFFRGYFYTKLRSTNLGLVKSIFISSIFFGLFHISWYVSPSPPYFISNLNQMLFHIGYTSVFGIFMCIIYERTRSLITPIIIHGFANSLGASIILSHFVEITTQSLIWFLGLITIFGIPTIYILIFWIIPKLTKWTNLENKIPFQQI